MQEPTDVLIVEDNRADAELLAVMLRPLFPGITLNPVRTLREAMDVLSVSRPDLVFLDMGLPDATGLEGLEMIRDLHEDVAVIVLTGNADDALSVRALNAGAQDYLIKGCFDSESLRRSVRYAMARREHRRLQIELEREQRLSTLGQIVSALAHQLNNPSGIVLANQEMMVDALDELEGATPTPTSPQRQSMQDLRECLGDVAHGMQRINQLVNEMSTYCGAIKDDSEVVPLFGLLSNVLGALEPVRHGHVEVRTRLDRDILLRGSAAKLSQVIQAVVLNANDAMSDPGVHYLTITVLESEGRARLVVEDTGRGLQAALVRRVFEPFFSTKDKQVGLGLTLTREIVRSYGGNVSFESELGRGSKVTFDLACAPAQDREATSMLAAVARKTAFDELAHVGSEDTDVIEERMLP
ncbi:MAG: hybrid sensor histidine kinase/response regulator [Myxococcota bacterium]